MNVLHIKKPSICFRGPIAEVISNSKSRKQTKQRVEYAVKLAGQSLCNSLA
jgi:hypothetical protein